MRRRSWVWLALLGAGLFGSPSSRAQSDAARTIQTLIAGLDLDEARRELGAADADDPGVALERARLAIYELDCDGAATILERPELRKSEAGEQLGDIARGCQRVTAALAVDRDEARGIEVRWQDEHDRALAPLLFETVAAAREALTRDLKVDWPRPTRIVVVRDLLSLSAMTGLPYKSAQTTSTVAVAKWGRVTLLSPRATRHGYTWRDTVAHELTHLAVTRASRDRAPLWLQEGVAKREEIRWRDPGPFDDRPPADAVVVRGERLHLTLPLDKLGPSIAMLPSADAAMVAFAEVTSFLAFYAREEGEGALPNLMAELADGKDPDTALRTASNMDLHAWDARWRAYLATYRPETMAGIDALGEDERDSDKLTRLRDGARLAELLMARNHPAEALVELGPEDRTSDAASAEPSFRWLRARALEGAGRREEGAPLLSDPARALASYAPWWATRGRWARMSGDEREADSSFEEAVASDPFDVEAACETIDDGISPNDAEKASLCVAARAAREPPFDD